MCLLVWCYRCVLRMALWRSSKCSLAMEEVTREDQEQHECQEQLKDLLQVGDVGSSTGNSAC